MIIESWLVSRGAAVVCCPRFAELIARTKPNSIIIKLVKASKAVQCRSNTPVSTNIVYTSSDCCKFALKIHTEKRQSVELDHGSFAKDLSVFGFLLFLLVQRYSFVCFLFCFLAHLMLAWCTGIDHESQFCFNRPSPLPPPPPPKKKRRRKSWFSWLAPDDSHT